jgi:type IX secretion system substrate protein
MNYRSAILIPLLLMLLLPLGAMAQSSGASGAVAPQLSCTITVSDDELFYVDNDYSPDRVTVTVTVTNSGDEAADSVFCYLSKDLRFVTDIDPRQPVNPASPTFSLDPGTSETVVYTIFVAAADSVDTDVDICAVITSTRGYTQCCEQVWVEKETKPLVICKITKLFQPIFFNETLNSYDPDTAIFDIQYINQGQDRLRDATLTMVVPAGVSPDSGGPFLTIGDIGANSNGNKSMGVVPIRRINDTCVIMMFIIEGRGGYRNYLTKEIPIMQFFCIDTLCFPLATQPVYDLKCSITPDTILYIDHELTPATFTFTLDVQNIGTALGVGPKATIRVPSGVKLAAGSNRTQDVRNQADEAQLLVGEFSKPITWVFEAQEDKDWRTVEICVTVTDFYFYSATTCCSVNIDSTRQVNFAVRCACPDTIRVIDSLGTYENNPFDVKFWVANVGTDYADSVVATLSLAPDLEIVTPGLIQPLNDDLLRLSDDIRWPRKDTLHPELNDITDPNDDYEWEFVWNLNALPRGISGSVTLRFTVYAANGEQQQCECEIFIERLDPPDVVGICTTDPPDTLHISSSTGLYEPPRITYTLELRNMGTGTAENVKAFMELPENMIFAQGYASDMPVVPSSIGPNDVVTVTWEIIPLARLEKGANIPFRVNLTSDNQDGIPPVICWVFVPAIPPTAALSISRDNVTYCGSDRVTVPVYIDQSDGKDIKEIDLRIRYNVDDNGNPLPVDALLFLGPEPAYPPSGVYPGDWAGINSLDVTNIPGADVMHDIHLKFSGPDGSPLSSYGKLFYLHFKPIFGCGGEFELEYIRSELLWPIEDSVKSQIRINDGSIAPILRPGLVTIAGDCLRPVNASGNYIISQNRPNPFNPTTTIDYVIPAATHVRIEVSDVLGRTVKVLVDEIRSEGTHSVIFNADGLPSGMYFYRMDAGDYSKIMKMMVSK